MARSATLVLVATLAACGSGDDDAASAPQAGTGGGAGTLGVGGSSGTTGATGGTSSALGGTGATSGSSSKGGSSSMGGSSSKGGSSSTGGSSTGGSSMGGSSSARGGGGGSSNAGSAGSTTTMGPPAARPDGSSPYEQECHGDTVDCVDVNALRCLGIRDGDTVFGYSCSNTCESDDDCSTAPASGEATAGCVDFVTQKHCLLVCAEQGAMMRSCPEGMGCYVYPGATTGYCLWQ